MKLIPKLIFAVLILFSFMLFLGYFRYHIINAREVRGAQNFLSEIIESDSPSSEWISKLDQDENSNASEGFYFFKTFFASEGLTVFDIKTSFCNGLFEDEYGYYLYLSYGKDLPEISVRIREVNNELVFFPHFSLNNCLFSPDYNKDGNIDLIDVNLAEIKFRKKNL